MRSILFLLVIIAFTSCSKDEIQESVFQPSTHEVLITNAYLEVYQNDAGLNVIRFGATVFKSIDARNIQIQFVGKDNFGNEFVFSPHPYIGCMELLQPGETCSFTDADTGGFYSVGDITSIQLENVLYKIMQ